MADIKSRAASDAAAAVPRRTGPGSEIRSRWPLAFGKYELLRRMRLGGMAEVFRACEPPDRDRLLAIKRILPSFTDEADYVAMFIDEARLSMRFQHPGIVRAFELGQIGDEYYIALEYVDGQDVATLLARAREQSQPLPVAIACRIALDVCAALEYAHALRGDVGEPLAIVHRDVSPQNVLVSYSGDVKLIDFGIAKSTEQLMRTQAGLLKGKYGYLSPEQARGQTLDRRSDLFSLGVCLYEMLSATRLFEGKNDFSTMRKVREGEIVSLHRRNASVPPALSAIVQRALARQRNDRFQTAGEMAVALEGFVRAGNHRCDREQLAQFMRERFRDEAAAAASEQDAAGDPTTGLLEAFEGLEPRSSVSQMAVAPPMPEEVGNDLLESLEAPEEAEQAEEADTDPPRALDAAHSSDRGSAAAPVEDETTRVVAYSSTVEGELAENRTRPRRDSSVREHVASGDTTRARRQPSGPSRARSSAPAAAAQPPERASPKSEEPLREQVARESMDWDEDELSTHLYDPPEKKSVTAEYGVPPQLDLSALQSPAWQDAREMHEPPTRPARTRIPTLRPMPSDPVPAGSPATTLHPMANGSVHDGGATRPVASIRPAPVISAVPTPRIGSMRSVPAPAMVGPMLSQPPAVAEYGVPSRAQRSVTTKRIAAIAWFPVVATERPRVVAMAIAAACVLIAIAAVMIARAPEPSTIQVATEPVDAVVTLDGVQVAGSTSPFVFTHVTPDAPHIVAVTKPGFRGWNTTINLRSGRELKLPLVHLERQENVAVAVPARSSVPQPSKAVHAAPRALPPKSVPRVLPAQPDRRSAPPPARATRASKRAQPTRVAAPSKPPAPASAQVASAQPSHIVTVAPVPRGDVGTGKLRINSRPWSQVYVDGRLIGNTPRTDVVLSAGVHTITLISPGFGYKRVLAVPIKRGETLTKIVDLAN
jgi:serine/threonine protein kinase